MALRTAHRPPTTRRQSGALVWQRTGTIGTELVLGDGGAPSTVSGTAVIGGSLPYVARWSADLDATWRVRSLSVTTEGTGWQRNLTLSHGDDGWTVDVAECGGAPGPAAGLDDPARLTDVDVLLLAESPIFLSWALWQLGCTPESGPVAARTARVRLPWLTVVPAPSTFQRVGDHRLRVTGDGPVSTYDLDAEGIVTYQPGRLRIAS